MSDQGVCRVPSVGCEGDCSMPPSFWWFALSLGHSSACRSITQFLPSSSRGVFPVSLSLTLSCAVYVQVSPFYTDARHIRLGLNLMISF